MKNLSRMFLASTLALTLSGCGAQEEALALARALLLQGSGTSGKLREEPPPTNDGAQLDLASCHFCGDQRPLRGTLALPDGSSATLTGWVVAAFERESRIARVAEVDAVGNFSLDAVNTRVPQTLAILTPDYVVAAVLSMPNATPSTIRQFFVASRTQLPALTLAGPIATFADFDGIRPTRDLASDQNGDGIPDGSVSIGYDGARRLRLVDGPSDSAIDLDQDGVRNELDPDIDGDGIINVLDPDDNGNGVLDIFDPDANGDYVADNAPGQHDTDPYFSAGVEFVSVQFLQKPKDDGIGNEISLTFRTKVREDVSPIAVQVRGAPSLLNHSYFLGQSMDGVEQRTAFNRLLADDGLSDDGRANDRVFGKKIFLDQGRRPRAHEALFFQLVLGRRDAPRLVDFPVVFPDLRPQEISAQYDHNTRTTLFVGNPFGEDSTFQWNVYVYDALGRTVWVSQAVGGDQRTATIPEHIFVAGAAYTFALSASVMDKLPGLSAFTVFTRKYDVE